MTGQSLKTIKATFAPVNKERIAKPNNITEQI